MQGFNESIDKSREALDATNDSTREATQTMNKGVLQALESGAKAIQTQVQESLGQLAEASESVIGRIIVEMQTASREASSSMMEAMSGFQERVKDLDRSASHISSILEDSAESMTQIDLINDDLRNLHVEVASTIKSIKNTSDNLSLAAEQASKSTESNAKVIESMKGVAATFAETQGQLQGAWENYQSRFEGVDVSLQKVFTEIDEALTKYTTTIQEFVTELDVKTGAGLQTLSSAISEMGQVVEELSETYSKVNR